MRGDASGRRGRRVLEDSPAMRCLVTGTDTSGRSCVVNDTEIELVEGQPVSFAQLYALERLPPPARLPGASTKLDLGVTGMA